MSVIFKYFSCTPHTSLNAVKYVAGMRIGMLLELRRGADPYLIIFLNGEKLGASISLPPDRTWHAVASMGTNNSTVQIIPKPQWPSLVDRSSGLSHLYRSTRDKGLLFRTRIAKYTEQLVQFRKSMSSPTRS